MNKLVLSGDVAWYEISANYVREELQKISGDVEIQINSGGGSFFEGVEIFNLIREYAKTKGQVTTVNTSLCASAASHIFCAGDIRKSHSNSSIMIHKSWSFSVGDADTMEKDAQLLRGIDGVQVNTYTAITNLSTEEQTELLNAETWYIGSDALMESGLVTEIIEDERVGAEDPKTAYLSTVNTMKEKGEHNTDMKRVAKAIKSCGGKCSLATMPTAESNKMANQTQGNHMEFNEDNFKVLMANRTTLTTRLETAKLDIEELNTSLANRDAEIVTLKESNEQDVLTAVGEAQDKFITQSSTRIKEAFASNVANADTVVEMINAESDEKSSEVLLNSEKTEALNQGEGSVEASAWDNIVKKKG